MILWTRPLTSSPERDSNLPEITQHTVERMEPRTVWEPGGAPGPRPRSPPSFSGFSWIVLREMQALGRPCRTGIKGGSPRRMRLKYFLLTSPCKPVLTCRRGVEAPL